LPRVAFRGGKGTMNLRKEKEETRPVSPPSGQPNRFKDFFIQKHQHRMAAWKTKGAFLAGPEAEKGRRGAAASAGKLRKKRAVAIGHGKKRNALVPSGPRQGGGGPR